MGPSIFFHWIKIEEFVVGFLCGSCLAPFEATNQGMEGSAACGSNNARLVGNVVHNWVQHGEVLTKKSDEILTSQWNFLNFTTSNLGGV